MKSSAERIARVLDETYGHVFGTPTESDLIQLLKDVRHYCKLCRKDFDDLLDKSKKKGNLPQ